MIYVLEGMPSEWVRLSKIINSSTGNFAVDINYNTYYMQSSLASIQSKLKENKITNELIYFDLNKYAIKYSNSFRIVSNPVDDWSLFQKEIQQNIKRLVTVIKNVETELQYSQIKEYLNMVPKITNCKLGIASISDKYKYYFHELFYTPEIDSLYYEHFLPMYSYLTYRVPSFEYFDVNIDNNGLISLKGNGI